MIIFSQQTAKTSAFRLMCCYKLGVKRQTLSVYKLVYNEKPKTFFKGEFIFDKVKCKVFGNPLKSFLVVWVYQNVCIELYQYLCKVFGVISYFVGSSIQNIFIIFHSLFVLHKCK